MKKIIICIIVCMLTMTSIIGAVSESTSLEKVYQPLIRGQTLYVGGSGPNNYTRIQDAVDNSSDGDTVFVYDDSSPYNENILVGKSIVIQGENKCTTIIDSGGFRISTDHVKITGFTVQNGGTGVYIGGVLATASYNIVDNNLFFNVTIGVDIYYGEPTLPEFTEYGYNIISNNVIRYTKFYGIRIVEGRNNIVTGNDVAPGDAYNASYGYGFGIGVTGAFNNISYNTVSENEREGIHSADSYKNVIYRNTLKGNKWFGLLLSDASFDRIIQNNFIDNHRNARMINSIPFSLESHRGFYPIFPNFWDGNYWDKQRTLPYPIGGLLVFKGIILDFLYMTIAGGDKYDELWMGTINYLRFDWHPAQEPYNIGG